MHTQVALLAVSMMTQILRILYISRSEDAKPYANNIEQYMQHSPQMLRIVEQNQQTNEQLVIAICTFLKCCMASADRKHASTA